MVISGKTKVCGVIGDPVEHSLSPIIHNASFEALWLDFVYLAFKVKAVDIEAAIRSMRVLGIYGLNVTMPHKSTVINFLDELDETAKFLSAVNTILNKDGRLLGFNTDGIGALNALDENGVKVQGKKVVLLGAGGAARAIAYALSKDVDELVVLNRTIKSAEELANALRQLFNKKVTADSISSNSLRDNLQDADILINATSVGMKPDSDQSPVAPELLKPNLAVMDIVYNPFETRLVRYARKVGSRAIPGTEMLYYQGAASFEIWTGRKAPVEVMRKAVFNRFFRE